MNNLKEYFPDLFDMPIMFVDEGFDPVKNQYVTRFLLNKLQFYSVCNTNDAQQRIKEDEASIRSHLENDADISGLIKEILSLRSQVRDLNKTIADFKDLFAQAYRRISDNE